VSDPKLSAQHSRGNQYWVCSHNWNIEAGMGITYIEGYLHDICHTFDDALLGVVTLDMLGLV